MAGSSTGTPALATDTAGTLDQRQAARDDAAARQEASLYPHVLDYLDAEQKAYLTTLTPFARELQLWVWNRPGPELSHAKLARQLGISPNTVNAWFSRGTLPEAPGFHAVLKATGWTPEHLMALTGYHEVPPYEPDVWSYLLDNLQSAGQFTPAMKVEIEHWLSDVRERFLNRPKRPNRKQRPVASKTGNGRRTAKAPVSGN